MKTTATANAVRSPSALTLRTTDGLIAASSPPATTSTTYTTAICTPDVQRERRCHEKDSFSTVRAEYERHGMALPPA